MSIDFSDPGAAGELPVPPGSSDVTHVQPDLARRRALVAVTTVVGGIGVAATAVPFIGSLLPSERAKAIGAPVEADITSLRPGALMTVEWQGKPVWILHRTDEMLRILADNTRQLSDPQSAVPQQPAYSKNPTRSIKPEFLVSVAICTHLGCVPTFRPEIGPTDLGHDWRGGFYCPCHGSKFDLAGRVYRNVPAPINLLVPRHTYLSDSRLIIGTDVT